LATHDGETLPPGADIRQDRGGAWNLKRLSVKRIRLSIYSDERCRAEMWLSEAIHKAKNQFA
jgi:hypothetical protein